MPPSEGTPSRRHRRPSPSTPPPPPPPPGSRPSSPPPPPPPSLVGDRTVSAPPRVPLPPGEVDATIQADRVSKMLRPSSEADGIEATIQPSTPRAASRASRISGRQTSHRDAAIGSGSGTLADQLGIGPAGNVDLPHAPRSSPTIRATRASIRETQTGIERTGPRLGRYEIAEEIARGGMGAVLRCFDPDMRRDVAVKVMLDDDPGVVKRARFLEEAQVTGQLEHPHIVSVHDVGLNAEGQLYFTMKLVKGRSLRQVLDQTKADVMAGRGDARFPLSKRLDVFKRICEAMAFAHSRGVIHRDLKPDNVMVGEFGEVQVMDWGIAKVIGRPETHGDRLVISDRSADGIARTLDGAIAGTPAYMPPEQAHGHVNELDERSDVYSLGAILYELLAFSAPVGGSNVFEILGNVINGKLERPSVRLAKGIPVTRRDGKPGTRRLSATDGDFAFVPAELDAVVMKAMQPEKRRRYASVNELRADIEAYLDGRALRAVEYSPVALLMKWIRRNRAVAAGTMATVAVGVVGLIVAVMLAQRADRAAVEAEARTRQEAFEARVRDAEAMMNTAKSRLNLASATPFNPADPQDYFLSRLPALRQMMRALQTHPDPPSAWKHQVAELADKLQADAQQVGHWAMAANFAGSAFDCGAIDESTHLRRLDAVHVAREKQEQADRDRLAVVLQRIAEAESTSPDQHQRLVPGELDERARKVARVGGSRLTETILEMLVADWLARQKGQPATLTPIARRFLIDVMGRRNDALTQWQGRDVPQWTARILSEPLPSMDYDEIVAWIWVAARLQAGRKSFGEGVGLGELLPEPDRRLTSRFAPALADAERYVTLIHDPSVPLPVPKKISPESDPLADYSSFVNALTQIGDSTAGVVQSGSAYTETLLEMVETGHGLDGRPLSVRQVGFVYDQLGLLGETRSADGTRSAVAVLRMTFDALAQTNLTDGVYGDEDIAAFKHRRYRAVMLAINLARLDARDFAQPLHSVRLRSGTGSMFWRRTELAAQLLPTGDWQVAADSASDLLKRGFVHLQSGNIDAAEADFRAIIPLGELLSEAYTGLARVAEARNNRAEAIRHYETALRHNPRNIPPRVGLALRLQENGQIHDALQHLDIAAQIEPDKVEVYVNRGAFRFALQQYQDAFDDFNRAVTLDPNLPRVYANRGVLLARMGRLPEALSDFNRALHLAPTDELALANRAWVRNQLRDHEGAIVDCDTVIRLNPQHSTAYFTRGMARMHLADYRSAIDDFSAFLDIVPSNGEALSARAGCHVGLHNYTAAIADCERAIAMGYHNFNTYTFYGVALAARNERQAAAQAFDNALRLAPPQSRQGVLDYRRQALGD